MYELWSPILRSACRSKNILGIREKLLPHSSYFSFTMWVFFKASGSSNYSWVENARVANGLTQQCSPIVFRSLARVILPFIRLSECLS